MFAATPQFKPADNTSGFPFADEGIDTATSSFIDPAVFDTPQQGTFDMQHSLTLDDTSVTPAWNTQLTPNMQIQHNANAFPPTPMQSFGAMGTMSTQLNALGKRPLQLEAHDFPHSKRHASYDFPLFPTPPATTASSWGLEPTPSSSTLLEGLSDEAADVCATWFTKYNVLPGDRHIDSLSQLTGEPAEAIRSWFGQLLKQGMGKGGPNDSAYKSQTALIQQQESFWDDQTYQTELLRASPPQPLQQLLEDTTPEASSSRDDTIASTVQPVAAARSCKKRCTPTDDLELLGRDPRKIYQCTRKCGKRYGRKNDWKRKEEEGYPCKSWVCSLCTSEGVENVKPCYRKYHFVQHFRNIHADVNPDDHEETSIVYSETEFPRKCGFCRHRFASRQERIDHIADHFKQGKCMLDWRDDEDNDGNDSTDDDNDDRPSGDGFDGKPYQQPPFDPRGGNDSHYFGGDGSCGGPAGQQPQSGFFHFQLSQLGESQLYCADQPIKHTILSPNISPSWTSHADDGTASREEPIDRKSPLEEHVPTEDNHQTALAGDVVAKSMKEYKTSLVEIQDDGRDLEHTCGGHARISIETATSSSGPTNATLDGLPIGGRGSRTSEPPSDISETALSRRNGLTEQAPTRSHTPQVSSFHSIKLLGAGGFSTVDEVMHQQTGLRVGRKTLKNRNQTALEELKKEVSVLQKLRHPHIIRFLGAYSKGDKMSILLSPVAETTLAVWLQRPAVQNSATLLEVIVKMFGCLASSVRYLHEQRPVVKHMDIKPQNILIVGGDREFPHVVLSDFGVSSAEELSDDQRRPWTRQYIAPEVFEGFTRKQAADIWSLGCVFAEMASVPFSQSNMGWLAFRKTFSGRTGTYYWQDVQGVQDKLSSFLECAKSPTEQVVVRTLQTMLCAEPNDRPDAASLTMIFTPAPCCLNWPNDKVTFPGPQEEVLEAEKFAHEHGIECHAQPHGRDKNANGPDARVSSAKTWLEDCMHTHEACHLVTTRESSDLPKRLIDILPEGQMRAYVKVVNSDSLGITMKQVQYVALSHVWNQTEPLLSSHSLSGMQTELGLQTLPVAVRNAISEAQRLGIRYCWLDSLCVLQDSDQDKEQECLRMSTTFRNATLTVVLDQLANASVSENVGSQVMAIGTTDKTYRASLFDFTSTKGTAAARIPAATLLPASILSAPNLGWDTRAWALQNRLLSRRFLHLGEQSYWECNTLKASETFPRGLSPLVWEKVHTQCDKAHMITQKIGRALNTANTNANGRFSNVIRHMLDVHGTATSLKTVGKKELDEVFCDHPGSHCVPNANTTPSSLTEPHAPLPSASRLRDCQWLRKQGSGFGQDPEAVLAMLKVCDTDKMASTLNIDCCTSSTGRSRRDYRETATCGNENGDLGRKSKSETANAEIGHGRNEGKGHNDSKASGLI
ncbi:dual specificity mitogen-activated protein kinase kinase 1 [Stemphylium lycopersici]|nr:dual specificity mitogen-activated protein kinase kinase 1 [Stemphylium lycopersici]RAQ99431.1 dual specificity mitogen-activated protein kinase kinase 1 [Stemphylium lycopersici]